MEGFKKQTFTDHTLAEFLREHDALNGWTISENRTDWYTPDKRILVIALYSGSGGMTVEYWVRRGI